jgi:hypothetical protein
MRCGLTVVKVFNNPFLDLLRCLVLSDAVSCLELSHYSRKPHLLTSVGGTALMQQNLRLIMILPRSSVPLSNDALPPVKNPPASVTMIIPAWWGDKESAGTLSTPTLESYSYVPGVGASIPVREGEREVSHLTN